MGRNFTTYAGGVLRSRGLYRNDQAAEDTEIVTARRSWVPGRGGAGQVSQQACSAWREWVGAVGSSLGGRPPASPGGGGISFFSLFFFVTPRFVADPEFGMIYSRKHVAYATSRIF